MYVIRYLRDVPIARRFHHFTLGRFDTWLTAEDARLVLPNAADLEVQGPRCGRRAAEVRWVDQRAGSEPCS